MSVRAPPVFGGTHGAVRPLLGQAAPIPSCAQFAGWGRRGLIMRDYATPGVRPRMA